ncbi:uncharacterized protein FTOL_04692 [Fusarium torulosum]|uniref:Uncharacterized protein n=1 Tax=Fusarium torulosum TaxID=33205 RepID=A0AAE8M5W8_9HYPO|nr:uncharacterized protein FTOL_04692 [Fusarium torulosum]
MDSNVQAQCLDLIRGIKSVNEKQNELLEKLVTLMADSTVRQPNGKEKRSGRNNSPLNASAQDIKVQVDEAIVSYEGTADNLGTAAQQDENLMNIVHFAPDSYKKRLQLFSIGNSDPRIRSQSHLAQYYNVDAAVNATSSWKYWYPSDWRTKYGENNMISPVPGFMPWWHLVRGQDKNWYHIDDIEYEYPIRHVDDSSTTNWECLDIPYSHLPAIEQLDNATQETSIKNMAETGLTKRQRQDIQQSLGDIFAVPQDGRLPLAFHTGELRQLNQYCSVGDDSGRMLFDYLASAHKLLNKLYRFTIIDITAPGGSVNAVYDGHRSFDSSQTNQPSSHVEIPAYWAMVHPALQRESDGFVAYPSVVKNPTREDFNHSGQWCRVIQLSGLAEIAAGLAEDPSPSLEAKSVWRLLFNDHRLNPDMRLAFHNIMKQHLFCQSATKALRSSVKAPWREFHMSWYQLCAKPDDATIAESTWKFGRLYGSGRHFIRQQAFTIGCSYQDSVSSHGRSTGESFWTILIMKPPWGKADPVYPPKASLRNALPRGNVQYCSEDVMLDAIRRNVRRAAEDWSSVQVALSPIIDHGPLFLDPNQHDNLLFDDDTFSRSRRYFWVVSCLESFQAVIDDAIEEWEKFCAEWPDMMMGIDPAEESSTTETSQDMTRRVLDEIETQVDRLRDISARFESSRDKTKVLREGLFSASGVIESRVSTRLGENVKLLTYVSIFYLPLSFCVALWSTNEDYARPMLVLTAVLVAAATFIIVANLRNMASVCSVAYRGVKRRIVRRMHASENDEWMKRATAFEGYRPERLEIEPSEWYILYFVIYSMVSRVGSWFRR